MICAYFAYTFTKESRAPIGVERGLRMCVERCLAAGSVPRYKVRVSVDAIQLVAIVLKVDSRVFDALKLLARAGNEVERVLERFVNLIDFALFPQVEDFNLRLLDYVVGDVADGVEVYPMLPIILDKLDVIVAPSEEHSA